LTSLLVILGLWLAFLIYAPLQAWFTITNVDDQVGTTRPVFHLGTAILLTGSDSRIEMTPEERQQLGPGYISGARSDVVMIYYIPLKGRPVLISLPRDSYLSIPGHGKNKLNAAYAIGGAPLLISTVEKATGLRINGFLEVEFGGFVQLVDAVGGVEVCLDKPMKDPKARINLPAGCQNLNGKKALGYVRQRYQDPLGDLGRIERQREILAKVVAKATSWSTLLNPFRYWRVCQAMSTFIRKGQSTGLGHMTIATWGGIALAQAKGLSLTVPIANADTLTDAGSSVLWDKTEAKEMFEMLIKGDTSGLEKFAR